MTKKLKQIIVFQITGVLEKSQSSISLFESSVDNKTIKILKLHQKKVNYKFNHFEYSYTRYDTQSYILKCYSTKLLNQKYYPQKFHKNREYY